MIARKELSRPIIEGYTDQLSYFPGERISLHVSSRSPTFAIEVAREGAKYEIVWTQTGIRGEVQPVPADASSMGCRWPSTLSFSIPTHWRSGYYSITLKPEDPRYAGKAWAISKAFFVVRSAMKDTQSSILLQLSTNTYNAYNNWGGYSLYAYNARDHVQGHRVSFDRPSGSQFGIWELPFVTWAEANGYILDYAVNSDLEFHPEILGKYKLILSVGHDEYWSAPMRDHLESFIANGGNVAFLSGNSVCWQVRMEDEGRAMVCWKQAYKDDPLYSSKGHPNLSTLWSHSLLKRPENLLTGVGFLHGGYHKSHDQYMDGSGAFTVHRPEHWLFTGTGLKTMDQFGSRDSIVGFECDGCELEFREDGKPQPTHRDRTPESFLILATAEARWYPDDAEWYEGWDKGKIGHAVLGIYNKGGTVVTVGTTNWSLGLRGMDPIVERITKNLLDRLSQ